MLRLSRLALATAFAVALTAAPARAAEPDKMLPADADSVAYLNVKQLIGSDVIKKYALEQIKQFLAGQDAKKLIDELGLDPLKDIDTIWAASSGQTPNDMKVLIVAHGKFDPEKLLKAAEAAAKKDGDKFSIIKDGGITLFKVQPDQGNPLYGTVVDDTVIAGTDKKGVTAAVDQKKSKLSDELTALVKKQDEKVTMFATSVVKGKFDNVKLPQAPGVDLAGFEKALPKTDSMTVVLKVTGDIKLEITMGMKDEDAAADMGDAMSKIIDAVKGFVPLIAAGGDPRAKPLADVVKTIKSDVKKKDVTVVATVTGDNIGKMVNPGD